MTKPPDEYLISITSRDRIGIVYEIARAISELEGNIADSRQSLLCGYYTMLMRCAFPAYVTQQAIQAKLSAVSSQSKTKLFSIVIPSEQTELDKSGTDLKSKYVLTISGPDHIGFIANVAAFCVSHQINILDLSTTESDGEYVMILLVDIGNTNSEDLRQSIKIFSHENSLNMVLQHYDIFKAVNEINLPA
ncbi:MAG: ACT domain-containing protein [Chloroflexota bacterium]